MKLGLYDLTDHCWLGMNEDGTGPKTFTDSDLAEVAREVACKRLGWPFQRVVVKPFPAAEVLRKKDEVPTRMTTERAIQKLEDGL